MIGVLRSAFSRFLSDPMGALIEMRERTPGIPVAAMALFAATLVMVIIDFSYGPWAYPHSVEPGGKRVDGAIPGAAVDVARIFATASIVWMGSRIASKTDIRLGDAIWMTVPYALALVVFELMQAASVLLSIALQTSLYGPFFMIGYVGSILVLVASVRALAPGLDWLSALPVGFGAAVLGTFFAPIVLLIAAGYMIRKRT